MGQLFLLMKTLLKAFITMINLKPKLPSFFLFTYITLMLSHLIFHEFKWDQLFISLFIGLSLTLFIKLKKRYLLLAFTLSFFISIQVCQVSFKEFFSIDGLQGAQRILLALMHPHWPLFEAGLFSAIETIYMAFLATILAIPFAFLFSFFAAKNLMQKNISTRIFYYLIRGLLTITRSIEALVWAIIFSVWVGIGPFSGMLALALHSIASLAKLYSEQIESIEDGPIEAMTSLGAHPIQIIWYGMLPQLIRPFLSFTIYRWDINVRMATIIGMVGGGGIGNLLMQYQGQARWNEVGMLILIIAIIVGIIDFISANIRALLK